MANPTTNFGWVMPTSSSLVTNLPADFNTFGQAVDTSMSQLKGGTTGQILSKTSATDMAFTWITNDVGDITAVTAGTGISGGGTSGAVTVTNSMATAITTAGDLIKGTGSGTFDRLGIGSTGQVLTVTAGAPAWATPASASTFVGAELYKTATQSIAHSTSVFMTWENEYLDTNAFHSTSTNTSRITIPTGKAGVYLVFANIVWASNATGQRSVHIWKNGAALFSSDIAVENNPNTTGSQAQNLMLFANCSVADYLEVRVTQNSGGNLNTTAEYCGFGAYLIGA
jgi:hypothetical protein